MRSITYFLSLILIFIIPWEGVVQIPGLGTGARILGFAVAAVWLATVFVSGRMRKPGLFQIVASIFVLWNAISVYWSGNPTRTLSHVVTWVQLLALVFIWWDVFTERSALLAGLQAYVLGAYVALGSALVNYSANSAYYTNYERFSPGETNPDGFGFFLVLGMPVAWYLASSESSGKWSAVFRLVNYAYIPAAFVGIALSGTRTASIAAIPAMAFGLASLTRIRLWARIAIFLLLIAVILFLLPRIQTLTSFQRFSTTAAELGGGDLNQRTGLWREGFAAFEEHPLLGIGSNMYRSINSLNKVAHNSFISVLVEVGLIGFALFAFLLAIAVTEAWQQPMWDRRFWLTVLLVWAIGASSLTWEYRKPTWLFLSLIVASGALSFQRDDNLPLAQYGKNVVQSLRPVKTAELAHGRQELEGIEIWPRHGND